MARRVNRSRTAKDRRYQAAVRRQIALIEAAHENGNRYWYADAEEFLRRGDQLTDFR